MDYFIIFGVRSFRLFQILPGLLGLTGSEYQNCQVEKRQRYFHLFFIPIFGLGTFWRLRKPDGELYILPDYLKPQLKAIKTKKRFRRIRANFGLTLLVIIGFFALTLDTVEYYMALENSKRRFESNVKEIDEHIAHPEQNTFFRLKVYLRSQNGNYDYQHTGFYRIDSITPTKLLLGSSENDLMHSTSLDEYYYSTKSSVWVERKNLKNAVKRNFTLDEFEHRISYVWGEIQFMFGLFPKRETFYGVPLPDFNTNYSFVIEEIRKKEPTIE